MRERASWNQSFEKSFPESGLVKRTSQNQALQNLWYPDDSPFGKAMQELLLRGRTAWLLL